MRVILGAVGGGVAAGAVLLGAMLGRSAPPAVSFAAPTRIVHVSSTRSLRAALGLRRRAMIVLDDGIYGKPTPFHDRNGHWLVARHRGKAVLRSGVVLGGRRARGGARIDGLRFDVRDPRRTNAGAIVDVWGGARGSSVVRTTLDGHSAIETALDVHQPDGFVGRSIVARNLTGYGIVVSTYPHSPHLRRKPVLDDVDVSHVSRPRPRSSDGTAESCIWLASPVAVRRARVRDCAWAGIWTGFANAHSLVDGADIDATPIGIYVEHFTTASVFRHLTIGPETSTGVNCEWASPEWDHKPASVDNLIADSTIASSDEGVYLDEGTRHTSVRGVTFTGQQVAGIVDFRGEGNTYAENDFSGIARGAVPVTHDHVS